MEPLHNKVWEGGEKRSPDAEAVGGAKVFLCAPAGEAQERRWLSRIDCHVESTASRRLLGITQVHSAPLLLPGTNSTPNPKLP